MSSKDNTISIPELIKLKRDSGQLSRAEISTFVQGVTSGAIQKSQIGKKMMNSGETFKWPKEWLVVDNSTGGVGDKVSLPLAPALAACGCKVSMISGRELAHTGGTLDKLESIPGFKVNQSVEWVKQILEDVGCYATSTVDSLPLIISSIISKKGAEGLSALVLDVKFGRAALYKDLNSARRLAQSLVTAGNKLGVKTGAVLSRMDAPIGQSLGNVVEVCEALEYATTELNCTLESGETEIAVKLENGEALNKFEAMLVAQGTDYFEHMKRAAHQTELEVLDDGAVLDIDGLALTEVLHKLGAGHTKSGEEIDPSVEAEILIEMGQQVQKGQSWIRIHHNCPNLNPHYSDLQKALVIGSHDKYETVSRVAEFIPPDNHMS
uniref:Thymidine phosphorylase n=1 Tax=Sinocyclocheilus grahami TaxID=75366 RepID=A0A672NRB8_SINGR